MNRRQFFILAVGAGIVIALVALLAPRQPADGGQAQGQAVLPGLKARINDIERLSVVRAGGEEVTLVRGAEGWSVEALDGYPADWTALRGLLANLAEMTVSETKTSNPAYFDRLGVEDVTREGAAGMLLSVQAGDDTWAVIVGKEANRQEGQYMRPLESEQSVLADRILEVPDEPAGWAEDIVLDYGPGLVAEVSVRHADGEVVRVSKVSADETNFTLRTLPEGREPRSAFQVNSMANPFSMMRMEDVRRDPGDAAAEVAVVRLVLFSGERVRLEVLDWDGQRWLRIRREPASKQQGGDETGAETPAGGIPDWEGWVYRISDTRMETLTRRVEDLLKPLEADSGEY